MWQASASIFLRNPRPNLVFLPLTPAILVTPASLEGSWKARIDRMHTFGPGLCTGRLGGRFGANLPVLPTVELISRQLSVPPASSERFRWAGIAGKRRARRGLRTSHIVGRFGKVLILGDHDYYLFAERIGTRVSTVDPNGVLPKLPSAELSLPENFCCPGLVGGVLEGADG